MSKKIIGMFIIGGTILCFISCRECKTCKRFDETGKELGTQEFCGKNLDEVEGDTLFQCK